LKLLDSLDDFNKLTAIGRSMVLFPLLPRHSRILMESIHRYPDVLDETIIAATFLSTNSPFLLPIGEELNARKAHHTFRDSAGDFVSYLHLYRRYMEARDKSQFCADYYLDERTMGEIANIKEQLQEIISGMGIPILSGGPVSSYLCSISKGLIQYVCVRDKRFSYRSLTAERIMIHPGSVMFKETPRYIVAGEIVRTSKLFARSVSPLEKSWLHQISPVLTANLPSYNERGDRQKKAKEKKDTTWQMYLGKYSFQLKPYKGKKKIALLPWEPIKKILGNEALTENLARKSMRGVVLFNNYELMWGEKLSTIVHVLSFISPEKDIIKKWPRSVNFYLPDDTNRICSAIQLILKLCTFKKKRSQLGFISLTNDSNGRYWFKGTRSFSAAVSESLLSLETLADEIGPETEASCMKTVNKTYRKLAEIYETL